MKIAIGSLNHKNGKVDLSSPFIENKPFCNEVYQIAVTDHPAASQGVPKIVGQCGKHGNVLFIREHGLEEPEQKQVFDFVKEWQGNGV